MAWGAMARPGEEIAERRLWCACIGMIMADRIALRSSIVSSLTCILGADQIARRSAEEELKTLEVTEGESEPA